MGRRGETRPVCSSAGAASWSGGQLAASRAGVSAPRDDGTPMTDQCRMHLIAPEETKGLFHKTIVQSGACVFRLRNV
ncbi:hypothetical protein APY04_2175 [Hyphomicrobium sulfonivorans]|uniref:Uncharacterized protein n=1 Tax=Hyphomicrobium sulfonivorans TaxID=121290 RepID=A0A109BDG5_HYPSL|nr:hypothetical protein APY04_2175 [Hyphomicrobium sulfonivorans]